MSLPKICLVMNVHQEQEIILQCLDSVAPYICMYCIMLNDEDDTTMPIIRSYMRERAINGYFHYNKYKNGAAQRTFAIKKAREHFAGPGGYFLYIDADNTLEVFGVAPVEHSAQIFADLTLDAYSIKKQLGNVQYSGVVQLLRADKDWIFESIIHEYPCLRTGEPFTCAELPGCIVHENNGQRKRDLYTHYMGHALQLERELLENKNIPERLLTRYYFYLGNSYYDAGRTGHAVHAYRQRVTMGGFDQEIYFSLCRIASVTKDINDWWIAWNYRPCYLEAAVVLMEHYKLFNMPNVARVAGLTTAGLLPAPYLLPAPVDLNDRFLQLLSELKNV